jgi:hypothetical protein
MALDKSDGEASATILVSSKDIYQSRVSFSTAIVECSFQSPDVAWFDVSRMGLESKRSDVIRYDTSLKEISRS